MHAPISSNQLSKSAKLPDVEVDIFLIYHRDEPSLYRHEMRPSFDERTGWHSELLPPRDYHRAVQVAFLVGLLANPVRLGHSTVNLAC